MTEEVSLATPFQPDPRAADRMQIARLDLNWGAESIFIEMTNSTGDIRRPFVYDGDEAVQMMVALNKANLSVKSLHRRILEKLIADGKIEGAIEGGPD